MNKVGILEFLINKYEKEEKISKELLAEIKGTIDEIEAARCMFNNVEEPNLIEAAIYKEESAKKRFDYLIKMAKENYNYEKVE